MPLRLTRLLLACTLWTAVCLAQTPQVVVVPVADLFAGPSADKDVVTQALHGAPVQVLQRSGPWAQVRTDDDYRGWIRASALRAPKAPYPAPDRVLEVDVLTAHVYREPDVTRHAPVISLPFGARLERREDPQASARWAPVVLPDGRKAWVQRGDLRPDAAPVSLEASLALARRFLGVTYTWGGTSSFGFDCSGFTQAIFRRRGVLLPRDAGPQAHWSGLAEVTRREDLKAGDLLFWGKDLKHIVHVGIYLGDGSFIHDTPKGRPGVQISELADPAWSATLVAMRRLK